MEAHFSLPKHIPEDIQAELRKCYRYSCDSAKIALYARPDLDFSESDLTAVAATIHHLFFHDFLQTRLEVDTEDQGFLFPAPNRAAPAGRSWPELLRYHLLEFDKGWHDSAGSNEGVLDWHPFSFVVVTSRNWRSDGVVLVHCDHDYDLDYFTANSCVIPVDEAGSALFTLQQEDDMDFWWRLKETLKEKGWDAQVNGEC